MNLSFIASRCTNALVSYLRWPSGGAGQAVLNFVKALPEKRHVVLFYECNTKWGLAAQPEWLISELEKYAAVFFLKPLITDRRKGTVS